ncbi:XdhC family aldehyde oxidoreductase maturation factor [Desulforhabdus amnigena]|jgi:xanthine dehydrogenase accessory factor|uniref:XdhC family aldehyde oxidoreductase maturation factor n=1 Tax=Desulforhabdus amnigena TaxID=40218 RepID=UPI0016B94486|nr:XdhC/CoxI family protein [Desulforhabdus amnigena]NLJ27716.1 XdhC family protein [Deltaproteobacteria bacterium]
MMNIFQNMVELLGRGEHFVLATVLTRTGSAPRSAGARMIVRSNGAIIGSVGGGIVEAKVQELSADIFKQRGSMVKEFVLTSEDAGRLGMACGGGLEILMTFMDASNRDLLNFYEGLLKSLETQEKVRLITRIPTGDNDSPKPAQYLLKENGDMFPESSEEKPTWLREMIGEADAAGPVPLSKGAERFLLEPIRSPDTVYIFGAGHVGQALAALTGRVGFRTVVLDDREEFANRQRFGSADNIIVLDSFENALEGLEIDGASYLVIVTRGHAFDKTVLGRVLKTKAVYIGMIGSQKKRKAIYEALMKEGFTSRDLERVHSPIGLDIGAETPEEIAVSIVAELIQVRASNRK